jgi:hypothetical protein
MYQNASPFDYFFDKFSHLLAIIKVVFTFSNVFQRFLIHSDPPRSTYSYLGTSGRHLGGIWGHLGLSGAIWGHLGGIWEASGGIWGYLGLSGGIWGYLGASGAICVLLSLPSSTLLSLPSSTLLSLPPSLPAFLFQRCPKLGRTYLELSCL